MAVLLRLPVECGTAKSNLEVCVEGLLNGFLSNNVTVCYFVKRASWAQWGPTNEISLT